MSGIDVMKETDSPITAQLGAAPGDLIHIGQAPDSAPRVSIIEFTRQEYREEQCPLHDVASCCASALQSEAVSWINVEGIHDASVIGTIGDAMGLHPLTCEDIMNASQRPKVEEFADYLVVHYDADRSFGASAAAATPVSTTSAPVAASAHCTPKVSAAPPRAR